MPVYYLRTGSSNAASVNLLITPNLWRAEIVSGVPPLGNFVGNFTANTSDYADPNNEFVIDALSGGTGDSIATNLTVNLTSNLTINNLSFGGSRSSTTEMQKTNCYFNIAAGITLIVSGNIKFSQGSMVTGLGALRFNTNNTGKLSIQGNLYLGHTTLGQDGTGPNNGCLSVCGNTTSIIEFAGSSVCLIRPSVGGATGVSRLALKCDPANNSSNLKLIFNKSTPFPSTAFVISGISESGITWYTPTNNSTLLLESNYDSAQKTSNLGRYNADGFLTFKLSGNVTGTGLKVTTDTKEIIFSTIIPKIASSGTGVSITNDVTTGSSFKIKNYDNTISGTTAGGIYPITANTVIEINDNLKLSGTTSLTSGANPLIYGDGTLKFVGSNNSIITLPSNTSAIFEQLPQYINIACSIEIAKTASANVSIPNNITDLNISRLLIGRAGTGNSISKQFKHTSGGFSCSELVAYERDLGTPFIFIGNSTLNTASKIIFTTIRGATSKYEINSTSLKTPAIEFSPLETYNNSSVASGKHGIQILGDRGFETSNLIHTSALNNSLSAINSVKLSSNSLAIYTILNSITMLGLSTIRAILESDSRIENFQGTLATPTAFTTSAVQAGITTRHYISQYRSSSGLFRRTPVGMIGSNVTSQSSFPKISIVTNQSTFVLSKTVSASAQRPFDAGIPAVFRFTGSEANLNINYVETIDIDSSGLGTTTIKANNSYQNRVGIPLPNMWRTINWDALNPLLPNVIEAYVE
jgi:hypothetical protein